MALAFDTFFSPCAQLSLVSSLLPRIINIADHWAVLVAQRRRSPKTCSFTVFDGLFKKEVMDAAIAMRVNFLESWFGLSTQFPKSTECVWGRCCGQEESWSCGHRIVLVFEHLANAGAFYLDSTVSVKDLQLGQDVFASMSSQQVWTHRSMHPSLFDISTPQKKRSRKATTCDLSPEAPVQPRQRRHAFQDSEDETVVNLTSASCVTGQAGWGKVIDFWVFKGKKDWWK